MPTSPNILESIRNNNDPDAKVMWQLAQNGSDLSKPHVPDFAFSAEDKNVAKKISNELVQIGLKVEIYEPDENHNNYEVVGIATMILELEVLNQLTTKFEQIAAEHNSEYLGWGAEVVE